MFAFVKAALKISMVLTRIAVALEGLRTLYELDLQSRGIFRYDPSLKDETVVSYPGDR